MENMLRDARFAHIAKDPRFRRIPKAERKVKIDKRFESMFKDEKFTVKYSVDKRGRPTSQTSTENLRKYYELSSSDEEDVEEDVEEDTESNKKNKKNKTNNKNEAVETELKNPKKSKKDEKASKVLKVKENKEESSNGALLRIKKETKTEEELENLDLNSNISEVDLIENEKQLKIDERLEGGKMTSEVKRKLRDLAVDYARGEGVLLTDSSSEEESSEYEDNEDNDIEHNWGELDKGAETTDEITNRLAVCNMDWDRLRAIDLMVLFNSFLPSGGLIHSVTIYPSEFGLKRMKEEEVKGPIELVEGSNEKRDSGDDTENEEGSKYHMEKLRKYQLNRLKYYYAVIVCDSAQTANKIYTECDGIEYESTATKMDLRFIPDDTTFDQEPREVCDKIPELSKYQPRQFTTTALQQIKVELTWDETNPRRKEIAQKFSSGNIDDVDQNDIQAYLGSGTSDDDDDDDEHKREMNPNQSGSDSEGAEDPLEKYKTLLKCIEDEEEAKRNKGVEMEITWGLGTREKSEKLVAERLKKDEDLTPFEEFLEKRKAKKKAKIAERKKLRENKGNDSESEDSVPSDVDMNDPYFAEERKNSKTKTKKQTKKQDNLSENSDEDEKKRRDAAELELLLMEKTNEDGKAHFDMKKIEENETASKSKKKRIKKKKKDAKKDEAVDEFEVNVSDPRFSALFSSHHYNIDPADPHYRKTKGTEALVGEKLKRRANVELEPEQPKKNKGDQKMNAELTALVKSVKRKAQNITKPIK